MISTRSVYYIPAFFVNDKLLSFFFQPAFLRFAEKSARFLFFFGIPFFPSPLPRGILKKRRRRIRVRRKAPCTRKREEESAMQDSFTRIYSIVRQIPPGR